MENKYIISITFDHNKTNDLEGLNPLGNDFVKLIKENYKENIGFTSAEEKNFKFQKGSFYVNSNSWVSPIISNILIDLKSSEKEAKLIISQLHKFLSQDGVISFTCENDKTREDFDKLLLKKDIQIDRDSEFYSSKYLLFSYPRWFFTLPSREYADLYHIALDDIFYESLQGINNVKFQNGFKLIQLSKHSYDDYVEKYIEYLKLVQNLLKEKKLWNKFNFRPDWREYYHEELVALGLREPKKKKGLFGFMRA